MGRFSGGGAQHGARLGREAMYRKEALGPTGVSRTDYRSEGAVSEWTGIPQGPR